MSAETILIIDDSNEIRALLETILPYEGFQTLSAATARAGLDLLTQQDPDLVLMDLELPDFNGLKILEQMIQQQIEIPVIMMTGYGSEGTAARALRLGAVGYLIKPFTTEEVLTSVEKALRLRRLQLEKERLAAAADHYAHSLRTLGVLSKALVNGPWPEQFWESLVKAGLFVTKAERCRLYLAQEPSGRYHLAADCGQGRGNGNSFAPADGDPPLRAVVEQGQVVRLQAAPDQAISLQTGDGVLAVLQVPLVVKDRVFGVLSVDRQQVRAPFDEQDAEMLAILADYAVLALEKNRRIETPSTISPRG
jgi:CheY-like chemotaxis protein